MNPIILNENISIIYDHINPHHSVPPNGENG